MDENFMGEVKIKVRVAQANIFTKAHCRLKLFPGVTGRQFEKCQDYGVESAKPLTVEIVNFDVSYKLSNHKLN